MSFSDVGRRSHSSGGMNYAVSSTSPSPNHSNAAPMTNASTSDSRMYVQLSDSIMQYQKNVGILQKMTGSPSSVTQTQINAQLDVIQQLGGRIDQQLRAQEGRIQRMSRADAAKCRATHVKLTRDYRRVEATFNKIKLEIRQRKELMDARQRAEEADQRKTSTSNAFAADDQEQTMKMELMLQENQLNEQLMREREAEIREINKGMHTVNEIYKDLAHIVQAQQEDVDKIETMMEEANTNAKSGLTHIEKAAAHQSQCIIS